MRGGSPIMAAVRAVQVMVISALSVGLLLIIGPGVGVGPSSVAHAIGANAIQRDLTGCTAYSLGATDDGSTGLIDLGFSAKVSTTTYTQVYVNNNGNVTFGAPLGTYTPFGLQGDDHRIIAPFFADVDTTGTGSQVTTYGAGTFQGPPAQNYFCVLWDGVGYYSSNVDKLNNFQLILWDRGGGDFDVTFNYDRILWETGDLSGGTNGFGGQSAHVGFSNGQACPPSPPC